MSAQAREGAEGALSASKKKAPAPERFSLFTGNASQPKHAEHQIIVASSPQNLHSRSQEGVRGDAAHPRPPPLRTAPPLGVVQTPVSARNSAKLNHADPVSASNAIDGPSMQRAPRRRRLTPARRNRRRAQPDGLASWIEENLNTGAVTAQKFMGGSSWSSCYAYETAGGGKYFVKVALGRAAEDMFVGEALGLQAMHGEFSFSGCFFCVVIKWREVERACFFHASIKCSLASPSPAASYPHAAYPTGLPLRRPAWPATRCETVFLV